MILIQAGEFDITPLKCFGVTPRRDLSITLCCYANNAAEAALSVTLGSNQSKGSSPDPQHDELACGGVGGGPVDGLAVGIETHVIRSGVDGRRGAFRHHLYQLRDGTVNVVMTPGPTCVITSTKLSTRVLIMLTPYCGQSFREVQLGRPKCCSFWEDVF